MSFFTRVKTFSLCAALSATCGASAFAGPIYTFTTSTGTQPSNVGTITISQVSGTTVDVLVDLSDTTFPDPQYGFLNTGGDHTPFAFNLTGSLVGLSTVFSSPSGGAFTAPNASNYTFTLNTAGGNNTPFGSFNVAIDIVPTDNGSNAGYFGDLHFTISRTGGLSTDDFISNGLAYFSADLTDSPDAGGTGAQGWAARTTVSVPDTGTTLALFGLSTGMIACLRGRFARRSAA
jgi:hypothetical protein